MKQIGLVILATGSICLGVAGFAVRQKGPPTTLQLVSGYTEWTKANNVPVRLSSYLDGLCVALPQKEIDALHAANPHLDRFIQVYVNSAGEKAMMKNGTFPVGSVIVKEKHDGEDGAILLSTVMIKREKGYNPKCGDWQFAAIDGFTTKITADGKLESCMSCHMQRSEQDFVFRSYIGMKKGELRGSAADQVFRFPGG
ncbi:MAG: cytochrome P460 family protein [Armatimonadota bacterium]